jgi:hypothetical protein
MTKIGIRGCGAMIWTIIGIVVFCNIIAFLIEPVSNYFDNKKEKKLQEGSRIDLNDKNPRS